jgi:hypothetical protein
VSIRNLKTRHAVVTGTHLSQLLLGRPRRRWEDNIKVDPQEVRSWRGWIDLAQDGWQAVVNAVMNLRAP